MKPTEGTVILQTGKYFLVYMPQSCRFDDSTTVIDTIRFFARLRKADADGKGYRLTVKNMFRQAKRTGIDL